MPNEINLGIDVDSRSVKSGERDLAALNRTLGKTQGEFGKIGPVSGRAGVGVEKFGRSGGAVGRAYSEATNSLGRFNTTISSTTGLVRAAQGAMAAFMGLRLITTLQTTTMELQKMNLTFMTVAGSAQAAEAEMAYVTEVADRLGQSVLGAGRGYSRLLAATAGTNISLEESRNIFEGLTAAATAYGMTQYELEGTLLAVQQMISKGSVQAEELRGQLGERLPGAFQIAAQSMQMTTQELSKALELGAVSADEFVTKFGDELNRRFGHVAQGAETTGRAINELENAFLALQRQVIEGGFQAALVKVLESITAIVASEEILWFANALGRAFAFAAENAELALLAIGALGTVFFGIPAAVAGAIAALAMLSQRTIEFRGESIKLAEFASAVLGPVWNIVTAEFAAAGQTFAVIGKTISGVIGALMPAFSALSDAWGKTVAWISAHTTGLQEMWAGLVQFAQDVFAQIPEALNVVLRGFNEFTARARDWASKAGDVFRKFGEGVWKIFVWLGEKIGAFFSKAVEGSAWLLEKVGADGVAESLRSMSDAFTSTLNSIPPAMEGVAASAVEMINTTKEGVSGFTGEVVKLTTVTGQAIEDAVREASSGASEIGTIYADRIKGIVSEIESIEARINALPEQSQQTRYEIEKLARLTKQKKELEEAAKAAAALEAAQDGVSAGADKAGKAAGRVAKATSDAVKEAEKLKSVWDGVGESIGGAMFDMARGTTDLKDGATGILQSLTEAIGQPLREEFDKIGKTIATSIQRASGAGGMFEALTPAGASGVGVGIGTAAVGALNGSAQQIGQGLGQAAGSALGGIFFGPVGAAVGAGIGSLLGGGIAGLFGGSPTERIKGTAFAGTPYERSVKTDDDYLTNKGRNFSAVLAQQGAMGVIGDYGKELANYLEAVTGQSVDRVKKLQANVGKTFELATDLPAGMRVTWNEEADKYAAQIEAGVQRIFDLGTMITTAGKPAILQVQQAYRNLADAFDTEGRELARALGFSGKEISRAARTLKAEIVDAFEFDLIKGMVALGTASKETLQDGRRRSIAELEKEQQAAMAAAAEIGADQSLVRDAFKAQRGAVWAEYRDLLEGLIEETKDAAEAIDKSGIRQAWLQELQQLGKISAGRLKALRDIRLDYIRDETKEEIKRAKEAGMNVKLVKDLSAARRAAVQTEYRDSLKAIRESRWADEFGKQVDKIRDKIESMTDRLASKESRRSDILEELGRRTDALRAAEQSIADVRKSLRASDMAPGNAVDSFNVTQRQFDATAKRARRGNVDAAGDLGGLAQELLSKGQGIYGSTDDYASLFRAVNRALTETQGSLDTRATKAERQLDNETFADLTEKSTNALLRGLGTVNSSIKDLKAEIRKQGQKAKTLEQKKKTAA